MKAVRSMVRAVLILYHMLGLATLASVLLATACWGVSALVGPLPAPIWIALCPALYLVWLTLMLGASALNMQLIARSGWQKPRRFESATGGDESRDAVMVCAIMPSTTGKGYASSKFVWGEWNNQTGWSSNGFVFCLHSY